MGCKYAEYDRYFGECICQIVGRPCRMVCGRENDWGSQRLNFKNFIPRNLVVGDKVGDV